MNRISKEKVIGAVMLGLLSVSSSALAASTGSFSATAFGNIKMVSQPDVKHTRSSKGVLSFDDVNHQAVFTGKHGADVAVPYDSIRAIRLEQTLNRLRTPFTGSVQHHQYVTVQYQTLNMAPNYVVFDLNGRSYRQVVASFEAKSGKQAKWRSE